MLDEYTNLMRQAAPTIEEYMGSAVEMIDKEFGDGYAKKHPGLVGAFIQAASMDYGAALIGRQMEKALETFDRLVDQLDELPCRNGGGAS